MKVMKGKYNIAKIMIDDIDETTKEQIQGFLNHPAFKGKPIVIMPDCHAGMGSCIGFTMPLNDYVIPNIVGVDIGCGVLSCNIGHVDVDLKKLDEFIRNNIPHGFKVHDKPKYNDNFLIPTMSRISDSIDSNYDRNCKSIGTLGGGNHFIELGIDEDDNKWLTVHTGSRKFGLDVANYHQQKAKDLFDTMFINKSDYNKLEFLPYDIGGFDYIKDMRVAQQFATVNRKMIMDTMLKYLLNMEIPIVLEDVESVHNFIDFKDKIIRKGAVSSYENKKLIIPFNMEDGLIIGVGKSNPDWNYSAPHGAGRVLSRKQAKLKLNLDDYKRSMDEKGIYTTSLNKETLDEVKGAYKNKNLIINAIKETVDIKHFVKPLYNFKSKK